MEEVAESIAANEHMRIKPAGAYALNKLGLSTQVPSRLVYVTDGQARKIRIGKGGVKFKPVSPKKFGMKGPISSLLIQGLEEVATSQVTPEMERRIKKLLHQETPENLNFDQLAPARINDFIVKLLKSPLNGRVA
ncbi:hypothetical protein BH09BAC6_BH09BAC6_16300 [soil metagenome]